MQSDKDWNTSLKDGDYQEESQSLALEKQRVKDLLASERHKNFIKGLNEISSALNNNPKAQMEHAKMLW